MSNKMKKKLNVTRDEDSKSDYTAWRSGQYEDLFALSDNESSVKNAVLDIHNLDLILENHLAMDAKLRRQPTKSNVMSSLRPRKKRKSKHLTPVLLIRLQVNLGAPKVITLRALLDSGTSSTILDKRYAKKLRQKRDASTTWVTAAGTFKTSLKAKIKMQLPQLSDTLMISSDVHLANKISPRYDMIIGRDLMRELGIKLDFENDAINYQNL